MTTFRPLRALTALAILTILTGSSFGQKKAEFVEINAGGAKIKIPYPADLVPKKSELKTIAKLMAKTAPTNTVHEIFAAKTATEKIATQKGLFRNADVQSINAIRFVEAPLFNQLKQLLSKQFDTIMAVALRDIKARGGIAFKTQAKVGQGTFVDKKDQFPYLMFSKIGGNKDGIERVSAACICFVKNRIILVNLHSNLASDKDATWAKTEAKKWIAAICKANQ